MDEVSRRSFLKRSGAAAAVVGATTVSARPIGRSGPAGAAVDGDCVGLTCEEGFVNVRATAYGARGDAVIVTGAGSIAAGSTTLTWTNGNFVGGTGGDVGKVITVQGAGTAGGVLSTTIASVASASQVTLNAAASTTVSNRDFAYGTDDTAAIVSANSAAQTVQGTVFVPPGIYMIRGASNPQPGGGRITFGNGGSGTGGILGSGGKPGSFTPSVFLCGDRTAGIFANGWAAYQGLLCDGNNVATDTMQNGTVQNAGSYATFIDVWVRNSAGTGWAIFTCQNNSYDSCGSLDSAVDGLYVDGGAGGLDFWNFVEANSGRYGVHANATQMSSAGYRDHTANVHFFGGSMRSASGGRLGTSKVFLREASDWKFLGTEIIGANLSGPTVDLRFGLSALGHTTPFGYGSDFTDCTISASVTPAGASPGHACFHVSGTPPEENSYTFLKTDRVRFLGGDTSVFIEPAGVHRYSARGWVEDATTNGPVSTSGRDIDTLLEGRTGRWVPAAIPTESPWSGSIAYRIDADGTVQLQGSANSPTGSGGMMFNLVSGYRPTSDLRLPAPLSNGTFGYLTITKAGVVTGGPPGTGVSLGLDGISFPVD